MAKRKHSKTPQPPADFLQEKEEMFKAISRALRESSFTDPEAAQKFLDQFVGMKMSDVTAALAGGEQEPTAAEQADELFFEAMDARSAAACRKKLQRVLAIDSDHVRALTALAMTEKDLKAVEAGFRHAIAVGERRLGPLLHQEAGHLWGFLEARPYLEARARLAEFLLSQERLDEAITEHQALLALNEGDNQGLRDPLLALLLETRRFEEARALIKQYADDCGAGWLYGRALLEFERYAAKAKWNTGSHDHAWLERQLSGMAKGVIPVIPKAVHAADSALVKAMKHNPWCALYLINPEDVLEAEPPNSYTLGSEEEAQLFVQCQGGAWMSNPSAMLWLTLTAMPWLMKNGFNEELARACGGD